MRKVEQKINEGLLQPKSLIESCEVLGMCKVSPSDTEVFY